MFSLKPGDARPQRADAARRSMSIVRARLRGAVELLDDRLSTIAFILMPDPRRSPARRGVATAADLLDEPLPQRDRRDEHLAELLRPPEAGQEVEQVGDVRADLLVGGEQPEVLVQARGLGVVVAGADVDVAAQPVALAADDERAFAWIFRSGKP